MASGVTTQRWHTNTHIHTKPQESNTAVLNEHLYILRKINHTQIRQITCSFQTFLKSQSVTYMDAQSSWIFLTCEAEHAAGGAATVFLQETTDSSVSKVIWTKTHITSAATTSGHNKISSFTSSCYITIAGITEYGETEKRQPWLVYLLSSAMMTVGSVSASPTPVRERTKVTLQEKYWDSAKTILW